MLRLLRRVPWIMEAFWEVEIGGEWHAFCEGKQCRRQTLVLLQKALVCDGK